MRWTLLVLTLVACSGEIDEETDCKSYGVLEKGNTGYMGEVLEVNRGTLGRVLKECLGGDSEQWVGGCTKPVEGGVVIWVEFTDISGCIEIHERCHAKFGKKHTIEYDLNGFQGKETCG